MLLFFLAEGLMTQSTQQMGLFPDIVLEEYEKGKDELTLAEFPLALAGKDPTRNGKSSVTYRDVIRDKATRKEVTREITIQGSDEFGLPTYYDEEILFGILQLTNLKRQGDHWPSEVRFSRYHLAKILGLKTDGRTYRRIWDSLHRLAKTNYHFQFSFFDKQDEEWRPSVVITFIQTLTVHGGPIPGKNGEVTIRWNEDIHRNFQAGYLRSINFTEYRSIGLPLAKALYRYLGKHLWRSPRVKLDLKVLAYEKLGLSRSHNVGQIKRALAPAIERLEEHRFIKPLPREQRYEKVRKGEWKIVFEKASPNGILPLEVSDVGVIDGKLIGHGVNPKVAKELVGKYPDELILQKIDEFEFLKQRGKGPTTSPGGWLAKSIRQSWDAPSDYKTPEIREREAQVAREEEERRKGEATKKKAVEAQNERISAIRGTVTDAAFAALTDTELEALQAKVTGGSKDEIKMRFWKSLAKVELAKQLEAEGRIPPLPEESD